MDIALIEGRLDFLRAAERLKDVLRSARTSSGRAESTAEHSWRLCLMAMVFEDQLPGLDWLKVLKLCIVHDLGEAIHGDIPATEQAASPGKGERERQDLLALTSGLDASVRNGILSLWDEYEAAASQEAKAVKALDKLETLLQHNQGSNPPDFDYRFNLDYGKRHTDTHPLFRAMRELIDKDTRERIRERKQR
ncbi:HD domain-containing protein [Cupriavidus gilardii]|uniref:HD domain-containing protein n=1 Tax=Cupriavidus gilardii TaxID=82541 RepID=UPI001EE61CF2|nr:HD domain-containing protein [Cupriavidus gilardii]MCG5261584.1 HD domain-containing protein [Cupriavidus gilardii]MDF9431545.1 HD domain-containing protein [Cupriavidus gilardii]